MSVERKSPDVLEAIIAKKSKKVRAFRRIL